MTYEYQIIFIPKQAKIALPRQFPCSFCKNTGFQTEQYLNNHMWTVHGVAPKKPSQPIRKVIVQSRFNASLHEGNQSSSYQHPLDASQANKNKKDNPCCKARESHVEVKKEDEESTVSEKPTTTSGMLAAWLLKDIYLQTHLQKCLKQYFFMSHI